MVRGAGHKKLTLRSGGERLEGTTLVQFSSKLRNETELSTLSDDLIGVVRETIQPAHVSLWLRPETRAKGERAE